jgi:hypothetical protein
VLSVVVTGVIASRAVAVLDTESSRTGLLSPSEVDRALVAAQTSALMTPTPTSTSTPTPTTTSPSPVPAATPVPSDGAGTSSPTTHPTTTASAPPPQSTTASAGASRVARTWAVNGGTVAAACTGAAITLLYATPQDGWTVDIGATGPDHLSVELKGPDRETQVKAVCVAGVPQQTVIDQPRDAGGHDSGD